MVPVQSTSSCAWSLSSPEPWVGHVALNPDDVPILNLTPDIDLVFRCTSEVLVVRAMAAGVWSGSWVPLKHKRFGHGRTGENVEPATLKRPRRNVNRENHDRTPPASEVQLSLPVDTSLLSRLTTALVFEAELSNGDRVIVDPFGHTTQTAQHSLREQKEEPAYTGRRLNLPSARVADSTTALDSREVTCVEPKIRPRPKNAGCPLRI